MEVKIGIQQAARELTVDVDATPEDVEKQVAEALAADDGFLAFSDTKGRRVVVPAAKIAYVEIGTGAPGTVGFRS